MNFNTLIISKDKILFKRSLKYIRVFNFNKEFEIYYQHVPILSKLNYSLIYLSVYKKEYFLFLIKDGILEFSLNRTVILVKALVDVNNLNKNIILKKKENVINKFKQQIKTNNFDSFKKLNFKIKKYENYLLFLKLNKS